MNGALISLAVLGLPVLIVVSAVWRGYVLTILWGWFAVPYFHLPTITVPVAIGVSLIIGMLAHQQTDCEGKKRDPLDAVVHSLAAIALAPALTLLIGWIVTKFL